MLRITIITLDDLFQGILTGENKSRFQQPRLPCLSRRGQCLCPLLPHQGCLLLQSGFWGLAGICSMNICAREKVPGFPKMCIYLERGGCSDDRGRCWELGGSHSLCLLSLSSPTALASCFTSPGLAFLTCNRKIMIPNPQDYFQDGMI